MTEIPAPVRDRARAAFAGRPADAEGQFALPATRNPWTALDDALAAVLDALRGLARVELNREVEGIRSAWRTQDAPTAPAQPATDATGDTETTGSAGGGTDDLNALRERIADALTQWAHTTAGGRPGMLLPHHEAIIRENSLARADAVVDVIRPVLESYEQARADAWTIRDNYAAENRKLITERNTLKRDVIDASEENHQLRAEIDRLTTLLTQYADRGIANGQRAEAAERERDALRAAIAMHREYLDTNFRYWCSPHGIASDYATQLIAHLDTRTPPDGGA